MFTSKKAVAILAASLAFATSAGAHNVFSETFNLPVVGSGDTLEVEIRCPPHHFSISGGFSAGDRLAPDGPLVITASYPKTTRTWAVELTNRSGRPTGAQEASVTAFVTCDHHW